MEESLLSKAVHRCSVMLLPGYQQQVPRQQSQQKKPCNTWRICDKRKKVIIHHSKKIGYYSTETHPKQPKYLPTPKCKQRRTHNKRPECKTCQRQFYSTGLHRAHSQVFHPRIVFQPERNKWSNTCAATMRLQRQ
ncbi:unnamed protein product [Cuscuta europaea]|uniref:C2H2-type domain-containing protein n=1 Tax=Cuscuta europaea TaxID=41803 RepID=A0A9P0YUN2_CUSEU|nr:unnamed protein product [Cuscuta europaea]